ncbi:unnamed protein product [Ranitomeya imitator]|uniref:Uncharacterized protein n=1 Tax=Ranitomeya imitator TaxID=111125 RepID=A0ABN9LTX2_9NEOB|nr:unnamed protein product [Ranitomeya imitator]
MGEAKSSVHLQDWLTMEHCQGFEPQMLQNYYSQHALKAAYSLAQTIKTAIFNIGEEQTQNPYTELTALKAHHDIVRFLVQVDDNR